MICYRYKDCEILFVGINPHPGSLRRGVPFSNNKMFWYLLSDAGLVTESRDELRDDVVLAKMYKERFNDIYKFGFINIIDRPTRDITGLLKNEELPGRKRITQVIKSEQPKVICFIGKVTYERYTGSKYFTFGWQENIDESAVYVMHAPLRGKAIVRIEELQKIKCFVSKNRIEQDRNPNNTDVNDSSTIN